MQHTKESRLNSRKYQFDSLIASGYAHEVYNELDFFTCISGKYFSLKVFRGTGANPVDFRNYHTEERRTEAVNNYKKNLDSRKEFKAQQKEKNKGKSSSHSAAAAALKAELTAKFPNIKFSVKSDSYSGGDAVRVNWTDGPTSEEVEKLSGKYQYGHFNGMEDIYENTNSRDDIPQVKYVTESREMSEQVKALDQSFSEMFHPDQSHDHRNAPEQIFYRVFCKTSFPCDADNLRVEKTEQEAGQYEDFYKIAFDSESIKTESKTTQTAQPIQEVKGEINIIDYSEKAFAVIGDTKPIKDHLKSLGGSFNPRLTCGPGWIFSKKKLDEVTAALSEPAVIEEEKETTIKDEVQKMIEYFAEIDIRHTGEITESTKECAKVQCIDISKYEGVRNSDNLKDITEAANTGKVISILNLSQLVNQ